MRYGSKLLCSQFRSYTCSHSVLAISAAGRSGQLAHLLWTGALQSALRFHTTGSENRGSILTRRCRTFTSLPGNPLGCYPSLVLWVIFPAGETFSQTSFSQDAGPLLLRCHGNGVIASVGLPHHTGPLEFILCGSGSWLPLTAQQSPAWLYLLFMFSVYLFKKAVLSITMQICM